MASVYFPRRMFGEQVQKFSKKGRLFYGSNKCMCTAIHCNNNSGIFTTVNSTHFPLIAEYTKYTKPQTVALNCNNNLQKYCFSLCTVLVYVCFNKCSLGENNRFTIF